MVSDLKIKPPSKKSKHALTQSDTVFLDKYLGAFQDYLFEANVSEICVNKPCEIWVERMGVPIMEFYKNPLLTEEMLQRLARLVAEATGQKIGKDSPLLSATLPTGERIQFALPPASKNGVALSIRKQVVKDLSLNDYEKNGAFDNAHITKHIQKDN